MRVLRFSLVIYLISMPACSFIHKIRGENGEIVGRQKMTLPEYFLEKYQIRLRYTRLGAIETSKKDNDGQRCYLPPEVPCHL